MVIPAPCPPLRETWTDKDTLRLTFLARHDARTIAGLKLSSFMEFHSLTVAPELTKDKTVKEKTHLAAYNSTTKNKININTCKPCAPGLVPPLPLALDEFGAQTPEPQPPLSPNPPNGDWDGELKFPCIGAGGNPVPKLVGLRFSGTAGGDGKVGGNTALAPVPVK